MLLKIYCTVCFVKGINRSQSKKCFKRCNLFDENENFVKYEDPPCNLLTSVIRMPAVHYGDEANSCDIKEEFRVQVIYSIS